MRPANDRAFTLIEVLAALLILSLGLLSAVGLVVYGMRLTELSVGRTTGMVTAMSIAVDPSPLLPANPVWNKVGAKVTGYINGFWVERVERDQQVIGSGWISVAVDVDVFETNRGTCLASFTQRLVRSLP